MSTNTSHHDERCVVVGASHAGIQCALRLRRLGYEGQVTVLGEETHAPYHRPPLSKDFLTGVKTLERIALVPEAGYAKNKIELRRAQRAVAIDRGERTVQLDDGNHLDYDHLVLAVGARVRRLDVPGSELTGIEYLRDVGDVNAIREQVVSGGQAVVVGGGYIGLETAASLRKLGMEVTIVESMERILQRVTGEAVSNFYRRLHTSQGVRILESQQVVQFEGNTRVGTVVLANGKRLDADLVVVGIGVLPNIELAQQAGLHVDHGICVNEFAQTEDPHIYAIGDCASFVHPLYEQRMRIESVQHAGEQALAAARSIAGKSAPYESVPWFWSDQYDVKLQIAGLPVGSDTHVIRGDEQSAEGFCVLHLKEHRLLAIDAINRPKDFMQGRKLISEGALIDPQRVADPTNPLKI